MHAASIYHCMLMCYAGSDGRVVYDNLAAGSYVFRIVAISLSGERDVERRIVHVGEYNSNQSTPPPPHLSLGGEGCREEDCTCYTGIMRMWPSSLVHEAYFSSLIVGACRLNFQVGWGQLITLFAPRFLYVYKLYIHYYYVH